jgi:hypothetical protein
VFWGESLLGGSEGGVLEGLLSESGSPPEILAQKRKKNGIETREQSKRASSSSSSSPVTSTSRLSETHRAPDEAAVGHSTTSWMTSSLAALAVGTGCLVRLTSLRKFSLAIAYDGPDGLDQQGFIGLLLTEGNGLQVAFSRPRGVSHVLVAHAEVVQRPPWLIVLFAC